ncbi:hypothetical protein LINPERHAP1_LOCUS11984 [Linum perenne]
MSPGREGSELRRVETRSSINNLLHLLTTWKPGYGCPAMKRCTDITASLVNWSEEIHLMVEEEEVIWSTLHASLSPIVDTTSFNFRNPQIRASLYFLAFPNTSTFATNRQISGVVVVTRTIALKIAVVFLVWSSTSTALMVGDLHDLQLGMPQRSSLSRKEKGGRLGKTALEDGTRPPRKL